MANHSNLRKIVDLSNLSDEEKMKLYGNLEKAGVQEHNKGFAIAASRAGIASSLTIQDSIKDAAPKTITEEVAEETSEEIEDEVVSKSVEPEAEEIPVEPVVEKSSPEETSQPAITAEVLKEFLATAVQNAIAPLQSELDAAKKRELELSKKLETASKSSDVLKSLGQLIGKPEGVKTVEMPNVNTKTSPNGERYHGRMAEFMSIRDSLGVNYRATSKGSYVPVYPTHELDAFMAEVRYDAKSFRGLMEELTDFGKKHGLFRGSRMITEGERRAATVGADIPGGFLEVLSSIMRVNARPGLVFWQFPQTVHRFDRGEGEVVDIPRAIYNPVATDSDERLLSGSGTYFPIDSSNARLQTGLVKFILKEYGRGRTEAPPISIPTFVENYSMIPLMRILERNLFYDYYNWEDLVIREQWRPTSRVLYNNNNAVATTAAAVTAGGQMTREFLAQVYARLQNDRVVPLPDGNFGLVTNPTAIAQLKQSLTNFWEAPSEGQIRDLTNMMLGDYPAGENIKIEGYQGMYEGFHIWQTNAFANAGAGTEGVQSETFDTGGSNAAHVSRTSYAFGGMASGRAMGGSGVQILFDEKTDFGRLDRAIWQSFESHGPLDVDATGWNDTSSVPQETRVFQIRTTDTVVV